MTILAAGQPFPLYFDKNGDVLDSGYLYFGAVNLNPETNPIQVYWDAAGTQPAPQPIRTLAGYAVRNGTPANVYINGAYSQTVKNKRGVVVAYIPDATATNNALVIDAKISNLLDDLANKTVSTKGAALVGFNNSLTYPAGTVGAKENQRLCPLDYPWLAVGDGLADDTAALAAFFTAIPNNCVVDLAGKSYSVYNSIAGTTTGDAVPLNGAVRMFNKQNVTILNGRIFAGSPMDSGTKLRYPSTFTIDGCTNINVQNVFFSSKGENYGDADASEPLGYEARRAFLAQNGGHACVIIRSSDITFSAGSMFTRCGSVGAFYSSSSNGVFVNDGYASAEALGYAGFAADSWCGPIATSGFPAHELTLNTCRVDKNGRDYSSKACVAGEDRDVIINVLGGVYKDAYANGSVHWLGAAFSANTCKVVVNGAEVSNCASVGLTMNSADSPAILLCTGVTASNLRTSCHIQAPQSFGSNIATYTACNMSIASTGTQVWSEPELSRTSVVANLKDGSKFVCELIECNTSGAHTFVLQVTGVCYGGIKVSGGNHSVTDRIFDSSAWGGATAGSNLGYVISSAATFKVFLANTAVVSNSLSQPTSSAINCISNRSATLALCYQFIDFDQTVSVESNLMRDFISLLNFGTNTLERLFANQRLISCYQTFSSSVSTVGRVKIISQDGLTGSAARVTVSLLSGKFGYGFLVDDLFANRRLSGNYSGPTVVGNEIRYGMFLNTNAYNVTVGTTYNVIFDGS